MATIAKGMITLVNVNDAYSVSVTPSACAIKADFDGANPILDGAFCDICVVRGDVKVPFTITAHRVSNNGITCSFSGTTTLRRMSLTAIPISVLSGNVEMDIETEDEFVATVIFQYSVTREATMLDWIKDWENNKTKIGSTYMITPKIFVGKRENATDADLLGELTGVYIGPSDIANGNGGPGIYGYKAGNEIFHINSETARIAHWYFDENALWLGTKWNQEATFVGANDVSIGSFGIIGHQWRLMADGSGKVAGGNISWTATGELTIMIGDKTAETYIAASSTAIETSIKNGLQSTGINITDGLLTLHAGDNSWQLNSSGDSIISGWLIKSTRIATDSVCLESASGVMGLYMSADTNALFKVRTSNLENFIDDYGGIYMQVKAATTTKAASANLAAYNSEGYRVFKLKSDGESYIAGWTFDNTTLYTGTAVNTQGAFTGASGSITLGPNGIRGYKWRLESDGSGAFADGKIIWSANGAGSVANKNISWNSEGVVTFSNSVQLNWLQGIQDSKDLANKLSLISKQMAYGKMLYRDPEFSGTDFNGTSLYPHNTTCATRSIITDATAPNTTQRIMRITSTSWNTYGDWRLGGFYFANASRANAKFVVRIVAKIPQNWQIANYHNAYGNGSTTEWLTSTEGTDNWEEYMCLITCGSSGTFSTINHFALKLAEDRSVKSSENDAENLSIVIEDDGGYDTLESVIWDVAYATVIDITASDKLTTTIDVNGIYTGTLRADQIIAGTIDATKIDASAIISNGDAWALNKDGSGYLANGNISWDANGNNLEITGKITATDGFFKGSLALAAQNIPESEEIYLSFDTGFNFSGCSYQKLYPQTSENYFIQQKLYLPVDLKYVGVRCVIENTAKVSQNIKIDENTYTARMFIVKTVDGSAFRINTGGGYQEPITQLEIYGMGHVELHAINVNGALRWVVDNADGFRRCSYNNTVLSTWRGMQNVQISVFGNYISNGHAHSFTPFSIIGDNNLRYQRAGTGVVKFEWGHRVTSHYLPMVMCIGRGYGWCSARSDTGFTIQTADDSSNNDLPFYLIVLHFTDAMD